jgi:acetyl coenzyme A synthetase (ADP forming)-like protein
MHALLNPASVAVIGASRRPGSVGGAIIANIKRDGFIGPIYPVNPNAESVQGLRASPTVKAIGAPVDLAVIVVPARFVERAVDDCIAAGVKGLIVITAGFSEVSDEGREAEGRIRKKVRDAGIRMVGPNCMGAINTDPAVRLNTTFTPIWPPEGNIGIVSQSGALGLTILDHVKSLNLGISSFVSVGNKADVSANDLLEYWADDPRTDVIMMYLESFGNPRKFARIAPEVVRRKPIIAVKAGRYVAGTRAASSHSAAMANLDVAVDALFEQTGVIRTDTLEEMFDVAALLSTQPPPEGPRVGVVTNAGGPGILLADACEARGLLLPELDQATVAQLRELLPPHAGFANPIDLVASDSPQLYEKTIEIVGADPNIDALVVIFIPPLVTTRPDDVASAIARAAATVPADKPVQSVFLSVRGVPDMLASGPRGRIPSFAFPENAAMALAAAYEYGQYRKRPRGDFASLSQPAHAAIREIVDRNVADHDAPVWLPSEDLVRVLGAAGIPFAQMVQVAPDEAAAAGERLGFPLVAKAVAPGVVHKTDVGGVIMGLNSAEDVSQAVGKLRRNLDAAGAKLEAVLLQRQVSGGIEALVGVATDAVFGPLLVCGMGGVHVELLKDTAFCLAPVSNTDAAEMVSKLRSSPLLDGYRGSSAKDRDALIQLLTRVSALVETIPELEELDLNPVMVLDRGKGVIAADGRMLLRRREDIDRRPVRMRSRMSATPS